MEDIATEFWKKHDVVDEVGNSYIQSVGIGALGIKVLLKKPLPRNKKLPTSFKGKKVIVIQSKAKVPVQPL